MQGRQAPHVIRLREMNEREPRKFDLQPDTDTRLAIADALGIDALKKLRFEGRLVPEGRRDWRLEAMLGATVVQECVVTLDPVTTRIDERIERRYLAEFDEPAAGSEIEMPEDDTIEPLPPCIDLREVMTEALALALPHFPRADGVELGEMAVTEPGAAPIREEEVKPFAGLADLRDKLAGKG